MSFARVEYIVDCVVTLCYIDYIDKLYIWHLYIDYLV